MTSPHRRGTNLIALAAALAAGAWIAADRVEPAAVDGVRAWTRSADGWLRAAPPHWTTAEGRVAALRPGDRAKIKLLVQSYRGPATYSLAGAPPWVEINPQDATLTLGPAPTTGQTTRSDFAAIATDSRGHKATLHLSVEVINSPPVLVLSYPQATRAIAYSAPAAASDPDGDAVSFSLTRGDLPPGLVLDAATGRTSGVPTQAGVWSFTLRAQDGKGGEAERESRIEVSDGPAPRWDTPEGVVVMGRPHQAFSARLAAADPFGRAGAVAIAVPNAPTWLHTTPDGTLSGEFPDEATTQEWKIEAVASSGNAEARRTFTLRAANEPPTPPTLTGDLLHPVVGRALSVHISATDPDGDPLSCTAEGLPPGLRLTPTTCQIDGSPTQDGIYPLTLIARDPHGAEARAATTLTIEPARPDAFDPKSDSVRLTNGDIVALPPTGEVHIGGLTLLRGTCTPGGATTAGDGWTSAAGGCACPPGAHPAVAAAGGDGLLCEADADCLSPGICPTGHVLCADDGLDWVKGERVVISNSACRPEGGFGVRVANLSCASGWRTAVLAASDKGKYSAVIDSACRNGYDIRSGAEVSSCDPFVRGFFRIVLRCD